MDQKLNNIFVPVDVAKLARDKGFNEWCACLFHINTGNIIPNEHESDFDYNYDVNDKGLCFCIPTHFQLIKWLNKNYGIEVQIMPIGIFVVGDNMGFLVMNDKNESDLEINEALTIALNLIEKP